MNGSHRTARRTLTVTVALLGALMLALGPTAAHAAGWGPVLTKTWPLGHSLKAGKTFVSPTTASGFRTAKNVKFKICINVTSTTSRTSKVTIGPSPFTTSHQVPGKARVTLCSKSYAGPARTLAPEITLTAGALRLNNVTIQRWYAGSIPV